VTVHVQIDPEEVSLSAAAARVTALAKDVGSPAWIVAQSFTDLAFKAWTGEFPTPFDQVFSGRIFGPQAEVRWVQENGEVSLWKLSEQESGKPFRREDRRYYLWGWWREDEKAFKESVVPDLPPYPLTGKPPKQQDRPYIQVAEYLPPPPGPECDTEEELMGALNQPRLAAHRFVAYDFDRDQDAQPEGDEDNAI